MPVYSYQCDNCGFRFEETQKFTDAPITRCPQCKKNKVRKLLTPPSIVFKGSGWYATDHRSPSGKGGSSRKSDEKSDSGSSDKSGDNKGGDNKSSEKTTKTESKSSSGDE